MAARMWTTPILLSALVLTPACGSADPGTDGVLPPDDVLLPIPSGEPLATLLFELPAGLKPQQINSHYSNPDLYLVNGLLDGDLDRGALFVINAATGETQRFECAPKGGRLFRPVVASPDGLVGIWDVRDGQLSGLYVDPGAQIGNVQEVSGYVRCSRDGVIEQHTVSLGQQNLWWKDIGAAAFVDDRVWFWPSQLRTGQNYRWPSELTSLSWDTGEVTIHPIDDTVFSFASVARDLDSLLVMRRRTDSVDTMALERWTFAGGEPSFTEIDEIPIEWWPYPIHVDDTQMIFRDGLLRHGQEPVVFDTPPGDGAVLETNGHHLLVTPNARLDLTTGITQTTEVTAGGFTPTGHLYRFRTELDHVQMLVESSDAVGTVIAEATLPIEHAHGTFVASDDGMCFFGYAPKAYGSRRVAPDNEVIDALSWWIDPQGFLYAGRCGELLEPVVDRGYFSLMPSPSQFSWLADKPEIEAGGLGLWAAAGQLILFRAVFGDGGPRWPSAHESEGAYGWQMLGVDLSSGEPRKLFDHATYVQWDHESRIVIVGAEGQIWRVPLAETCSACR